MNVTIEGLFQRPKTHYKRNTRGSDDRLKSSAPRYHKFKPDADNIAKFVNDSLNGLAFRDDCQINTLVVKKRWSHVKECTRIKIQYLEDFDEHEE